MLVHWAHDMQLLGNHAYEEHVNMSVRAVTGLEGSGKASWE